MPLLRVHARMHTTPNTYKDKNDNNISTKGDIPTFHTLHVQ